MKRFLTVFEFELMSYIKNKSFVITTILVAVLLGGITFLPRFFDMSDLLGIESDGSGIEDGMGMLGINEDEGEPVVLGIVDRQGYFSDLAMLEQAFPNAEFLMMDSEEELNRAVADEKADAGFYVIDDLHYQYHVLNREMYDENQMIFEQLLGMLHKQIYCQENNLDYERFAADYEAPVSCEEKILGKDVGENFWYCYALVIIIFMIIILYGVMIATAVTTEKSNRSIEVLVTSVDSKYLLFGKVFAGAAAVVVQLALILGVTLIGYSVNHEAWGNHLDVLLDIPAEVLAVFAVFGVGGFLFYAFLYGAMGALVSKTEDINKSAGTFQMVIMLVYMVVLCQLENPDGVLMKVCSFLPLSSYSAMFVRIGMGKVATWEVVVSAVILFVSIFFVGWLAAKIYRMGTLRYGNPIKLSKALKDIKHAE
ncbi:MAG: ABC transporter permease [Bacteroidales bacterium]|nr:ABC transporter permease [Clostridium sp.]MCM1204027.1 ABC transporter permease [Bacteroidales bacterium]